jgi:hypothetical protein
VVNQESKSVSDDRVIIHKKHSAFCFARVWISIHCIDSYRASWRFLLRRDTWASPSRINATKKNQAPPSWKPLI